MLKTGDYFDELYMKDTGQTFMMGVQALVKLPMAQRALDRRNNQRTAGLVSGYRGSPLGAYDQQLWKAEGYLKAHDIVFQPGLNEDLAATALWGAQMHSTYGPSDVDGVFGIWYGKGNGVDRTGDVFRNANIIGTSELGGVLAVGGDDHAAQSSMFPHQTDGIFQSVMMPVIQPSNVSEILSLGLAGIALSRYSGLWVGMKTIAEVVESSAAFELPNLYPSFAKPDLEAPLRGFGWDSTIQWPAERAEYERRMYEERIPAAKVWIEANKLDYPIIESANPQLVIVSVGKARQDVMEALQSLSITLERALEMNISVYQVAVSWPLVTAPLLAVARGAEEILVVEEKTTTVEGQLKEALYNHSDRRVRITGKQNEHGAPLLAATLEFTPEIVADVIADRLGERLPVDVRQRLKALKAKQESAKLLTLPVRKPYFCAGCPHNSSTKTPDGSISGGGIGCHVMALSQPKLKTSTFSQMGGEGLQWVGAAPFSKTQHIFQNLGDGTYQHSGVLAVRAAVAAKTNITFKILYNDAVAMTGGQPAEGAPNPSSIAKQLLAEGVGEVCLVSDMPKKWSGNKALPSSILIEHRDGMDALQKRLRSVSGVTAIIYEQTCASEKRRKRKRGTYPDPAKRLFINPRVCEGCGDCSIQSNCIAIEPLTTDFGRKRKINQSSCNKDFSCVKGFCPSFVEIDGPVLQTPDIDHIKALEAIIFPDLKNPIVPQLGCAPYSIYVAGIGGQGVLTIGALLGTAAYRAGMEATVLDFTGLAQKNGAVVSEVRIASMGVPISAVRIRNGGTNLLLATDMVAASGAQSLGKMNSKKTALVLNSDVAPTADSVTDFDAILPTKSMEKLLTEKAHITFSLNATQIAERLFGNSIAANMLIVGFAWQKGLIPLSQDVIFKAVDINGVALEFNKRAFLWGRLVALNPAKIEEITQLSTAKEPLSGVTDIEALIEARYNELVRYQNKPYANKYMALMTGVRESASGLGIDGQDYVRTVAENAYKLMAYKDEYEVARLYSEPAFLKTLKAQFSKTKKVSVWLAPPLISRFGPVTGRPIKRKFGPWVFSLFRVLALCKKLRGTWADPFGYAAERRMERRVRDEYLLNIEDLTVKLDKVALETSLELASLPAMIRGFGPVKEDAVRQYEQRKVELLKAIEQDCAL